MADTTLQSTWSDRVANDPKHRPQRFDRPSTTVRKEWCRRPQEAHIADGNRYRRLSVAEIAVIQGFSPSWVDVDGLTENERIAVLGNAVAPPVAQALGKVLQESGCIKTPTSIEICAGIGGLSQGFSFLRPIAKIEMWDVACTVLRKHFPPEVVVEGMAQAFDYAAHKGRVGLLCGGPPCQPWSQSGTQRGASDPRDVMGFTPEAIAGCTPDVFLFENVPGLMTSKEHAGYVQELFNRMRRPSEGLSYGVAHVILNAADYGVPQVRKRVFILGIRDRSDAVARSILEKVVEGASHHDPDEAAYGKKPWITLQSACASVPSSEPWRIWNIQASENSETIVDEGEIKPAASTSAQPKRDVSAITLLWPKMDNSLTYEDGRWRFVPRASRQKRRAFHLDGVVGPKALFPTHFAMSGDSTQCLTSIAPLVRNQARMVYMDAPRTDPDGAFGKATDTGFTRSAWMSLVRDIGNAAQNLLTDPGYFVLQTDEESAHYARLVLDEVFGGASHHVTTFACQRKYAPQPDRKTPTDAFDYAIVYATRPRDAITDSIGIQAVETKIIDDGDPRGAFTAGHKGARSGSENTKFRVNMPPYRWSMTGTLPQCKLHWFDKTTGVLYLEGVREAGTFEIQVECTDADEKKRSGKISFVIEPNPKGVQWEFPDDVWWLKKTGKRGIAAGGSLYVSTKKPKNGLVNSNYCIVLEASGGTPFAGKSDAPKDGRFWEFAYSTLVEHVCKARADFGRKGTSLPSQKRFRDRKNTTKTIKVINWLPYQIIGKSEDATRHLNNIAGLGYGVSLAQSYAKPEPLMRFLIELFAPQEGDLVVTIGDSYATMASACIKMQRRCFHLIGPSDDDAAMWKDTALPRIRAVLDGKDAWGISGGSHESEGDGDDGEEEAEAKQSDRLLPIPPKKSDDTIVIGHLSTSCIEHDAVLARLSLGRKEAYDHVVAAMRGFMPISDGVYQDSDGNACVVIPHDEILDYMRLSEIERLIPPNKRICVLYEQADMLDPSAIHPSITLIRVPFEV